MDPKLSNLDPKLQDAYGRVMNGPSSAPSAGAVPPPPAPAQAAPVSTPVAPQTPNPAPVAPTVAADPPSPQASTFGSTIAFNANNAGKNQGTTTVKKHGSKIMTIALGFGIIILLVAYTFVWIYVFKVQIPFLPQF